MASPAAPGDRRAGAFIHLRGATRWTLFGATVATVTFAGLAAHDLPGHTGTSSTARSTVSPTTSRPSGTDTTSQQGGALGSGGAGAPTTSTQAPVAISGGSAP